MPPDLTPDVHPAASPSTTPAPTVYGDNAAAVGLQAGTTIFTLLGCCFAAAGVAWWSHRRRRDAWLERSVRHRTESSAFNNAPGAGPAFSFRQENLQPGGGGGGGGGALGAGGAAGGGAYHSDDWKLGGGGGGKAALKPGYAVIPDTSWRQDIGGSSSRGPAGHPGDGNGVYAGIGDTHL